MGSDDDGIKLVPARVSRAILTCTTCRTVVAVGPPVTGDDADAAYLLGAVEGVTPLARHLGICAGGQLKLTFEQEPFATSGVSRRAHLRSVR
jgi:hypothetical protein